MAAPRDRLALSASIISGLSIVTSLVMYGGRRGRGWRGWRGWCGRGGRGGRLAQDYAGYLYMLLWFYILRRDLLSITYCYTHTRASTNTQPPQHTHPTHPKHIQQPIQPNHPSTHLTPSIQSIHPRHPPHLNAPPPRTSHPVAEKKEKKGDHPRDDGWRRIPSISFALSSSSSSCFCLGNRRHFHRQPLFAERMKTKRRFSCAARLKIKRAQRQNSSRGMTKRGGLR